MPACLHANPKDIGQHRMTQEEQRSIVAIMYKLTPIIKLMGKQPRIEFIKISETLAAFKQGLIGETEVIYEFINLGLSEIKSKDKLLELISLDEKTTKVNDWWAIIRSWAKVPALNSFILSKNQEDTDKLQEAALAAWQALNQKQEEQAEAKQDKIFSKACKEAREKGKWLDIEEQEALGWTEEQSNEFMDAYTAYSRRTEAFKLADKDESAQEGRPIFNFDML